MTTEIKSLTEDHYPEVEYGRKWPQSVSYTKRQVWAAMKKVRAEVCAACPFFKEIEGGGPNRWGQIGQCCYERQEAKYYRMKGKPLCM